MTPAFSHLDPGTPEAVWAADGRIFGATLLDSYADLDIDELVVVAAHPDDETLGAGGLIHRIANSGAHVTVVIATDGEASHPHSPSHSPAKLAGIRRGEVIGAVQCLAPRARVHFLGLPDGGLREHATDLDAALRGVLSGLTAEPRRTLIVAPWSGDGHRDHRVAAESVARAVAGRGIRHLGYPIWLWHWGMPDDVPWDLGCSLALSDADSEAKEDALRAHASQTRPLSNAPGDEAIVSAQMAGHFARDSEFFLRETDGAASSLDAEWFEEFYARNPDPWGFETRWYEERKRRILLSCLPDRDLGAVLEIGCSTGLITADLAERSDTVVAIDASNAALDAAQRRLGDRSDVTLRRGVVPRDWPEGTFRTIVLSEVGYYLSAVDLQRTIEEIARSLAPTGILVACHWRHPVAHHPLTGDQVNGALRSVRAWEHLVRHEEEDFILDVFSPGSSGSVARREGLT